MPTILDELTVLVNLDPSKFSEGQRAVLKDMEELKARAAASATTVGQSTKTSLHDHLSTIHGELRDVNTQLVNMGANSRRSGQSVKAGAETGAEGFALLAEKVATAYLSMQSLKGVYDGVVNAANNMATAGRAAWASGIPVQNQEAFATYAYAGPGAVPKATTRGAIASLQEQRALLKTRGEVGAAFRPLALMGVNFDQDPIDVMRDIAEKMQGKEGPEVRAALSGTPLGDLAQTLAQGRGAMDAGMQKYAGMVPTPSMVKNATELGEKMRDLDVHFETMWNHISEHLNPSIGHTIELLAKLTDLITSWFDRLDRIINVPPAPTVEGRKWNEWGPLGKIVDWGRKALGLPPLPDPGGPGATSVGPGTAGGGDVLALIRNLESSNRNLPPNATNDSGWYQINQGTWNSLPASIRGSYGSAWESPYDTQTNAATYIYNHPEIPGMGPRAWATLRGRNMSGYPAGGQLDPYKLTSESAYGVPGAVMNYAGTGAMGKPGENLVQIMTPDGKMVTVNKAAASAFKGFIDDLYKTGYKVQSIGGFSLRDKTGGGSLSEHAWGNAIDINPADNPFGSSRNNMPPNIHDLAAKYGLIWGGDWKSSPDPMHFQWGGPGSSRDLWSPDYIAAHNKMSASKYIFGGETPPGAGKAGFDWGGREKAADLARSRAEMAASVARGRIGPPTVNHIGPVTVHTGSDNPLAVGDAVQRAMLRAITSSAQTPVQ